MIIYLSFKLKVPMSLFAFVIKLLNYYKATGWCCFDFTD
jgi:hypothetical protein